MRSTVTVWKGGTYLRITDYKPPFVQDVIMPFCRRRLYRFGKVPIPGTRQKKTVVTHSFARLNNDRSEFRISAGLFEEFVSFMEGVGYNSARVRVMTEPTIKGKDVEFKWKEGWGNLREHQVDWCEYQLQPGPVKVNNAQTGQGKLQALDAPVLTPTGFVQMGSLKLGDKVISRDGTATTVTGIFPHGVKALYNLTLEDGRVAESGLEHLWSVYVVRGGDDDWETLDTQTIIELLDQGLDMYLPMFEGMNGTPHLTTREAYQLGSTILLTEDVSLFPEWSTTGSLDERWALLSALAYDDIDGNVTYSSESPELIKRVTELVWSLGGKVEAKEDGVLYIDHPNWGGMIEDRPCVGLKIAKVEYSRDFESQCIMVDHPEHLYVTTDYVVTHNTFMATHTMVNTGKRTLITCLPRYTSIWFESLGNSVELEPTDIMLVENGKIEEAAKTIKEGRADPKIIILPLTRYDTYLKREREEEIPTLDDVFNDMEIGLRIMDEAHEDIYRVYMSMLFGNFEKTIALSATLKADDPFVNSIYRYVYPLNMRLKEPEYVKYIDVIAYHHYIDMQKYRINTKGFGGYSHVKYEQAIMKTDKLYNQYLELCKQAFEEFYLADYKEGQKCLWFFSTVEMATRMKEDFQRLYPDMDIWKFTNEESKNKDTEMSYMEHRVVFTTPQSCGTGKDIPDLAVAFSPYACSSRQRNDQMLGRTRPLKNYPGVDPKFVYFVCNSIPKQKEYHQKRKELFAVKSKSHKNINSFHHIC